MWAVPLLLYPITGSRLQCPSLTIHCNRICKGLTIHLHVLHGKVRGTGQLWAVTKRHQLLNENITFFSYQSYIVLVLFPPFSAVEGIKLVPPVYLSVCPSVNALTAEPEIRQMTKTTAKLWRILFKSFFPYIAKKTFPKNRPKFGRTSGLEPDWTRLKFCMNIDHDNISDEFSQGHHFEKHDFLMSRDFTAWHLYVLWQLLGKNAEKEGTSLVRVRQCSCIFITIKKRLGPPSLTKNIL